MSLKRNAKEAFTEDIVPVFRFFADRPYLVIAGLIVEVVAFVGVLLWKLG